MVSPDQPRVTQCLRAYVVPAMASTSRNRLPLGWIRFVPNTRGKIPAHLSRRVPMFFLEPSQAGAVAFSEIAHRRP
jgi:hypothetical protein